MERDSFPSNLKQTPASPSISWTLASPLPVPDSVLRAVHASDQAMYPVDLPYERLRAWIGAAPDLSIYYPAAQQDPHLSPDLEPHVRTINASSTEEVPNISAGQRAKVRVGSVSNGDDTEGFTSARREPAMAGGGVVVVLPLRRRHWDDLLAGRLREAEIDPGCMFPPDRKLGEAEIGGQAVGQEEVGLHVYHVERFEDGHEEVGGGRWAAGGGSEGSQKRRPRFSEVALAEVARRAKERPAWRIVGMSALTATAAGERTFRTLGFKPTGYREVLVARDIPAASRAGADEGQRADMVCLFPGDESQLGDSAVLSTSRMVVKYDI
ncbi:hypothetical protein VTJ83DRAFT_6415 [Remersonia thermophila]|uniref:N-acetyltransferase domain-containing protein n=1 Tax=Remersonia thermophila TaxID=72144 RepID=A0ABR4D4L4_9PEZI